MIKEGKLKLEIVDYMIVCYGNFVIYNLLFILGIVVFWFGFILVLVIGFIVIVLCSCCKVCDVVNNVEWNEE